MEKCIVDEKNVMQIAEYIASEVYSHQIVEVNPRANKNMKRSARYYYTGGGYDTETTTIKETKIKFRNKLYDYNPITGEVLAPEKIKEKLKGKDVKRMVLEKPLFSFVYHCQMMIAGKYIVIRKFSLIKRFLDILDKNLSEHEKSIRDQNIITRHSEKIELFGFTRLIIWVANLNYEWSFLNGEIDRSDITDFFSKSSHEPLFINYRDTLQFRESVGLFGVSLEDIANHYCSTKKLIGDLNYNLIRLPSTPLTAQEQAYCYNDVKILDELSYYPLDEFVKKGMNIPLTQTGIVRQACKKALGKKKLFEQRDNLKLLPVHDYIQYSSDSGYYITDEEKFEYYEALYMEWRDKLYQGGLAHSNAKYVGLTLHNVCAADITSCYPYQISKRSFPSGELKQCTEEEDVLKIMKSHKYKHKIMKITFTQLHAVTTHTLIPWSKVLNKASVIDISLDQGRIYSGKNVTIWCTEVDYDNIMALYTGELVIEELWYFTKSRKAPTFLLETMYKFYAQKNELKIRKNKLEIKKEQLEKRIYHSEQIKQEYEEVKREYEEIKREYDRVKEMVNSIYGMTGTRIYSTETILKDMCFKEEDKNTYSFCKEATKMWLNPYIAFYTTAYARATLVYFISKYPDLIVQYDTDSLYYLKDETLVDIEEVEMLEKDLKMFNEHIENDNMQRLNNKLLKDLGTWTFESPYKNFKCLGAKRYLCETYSDEKEKSIIKPVIAGCSAAAFLNHIQENNLDPFEFFANKMFLPIEQSLKIGAEYCNDRSIKREIVCDYQGHSDIVEYKTFCSLYNVAFTLTMKPNWLKTVNEIKDYNNHLPPKYRAQIDEYNSNILNLLTEKG